MPRANEQVLGLGYLVYTGLVTSALRLPAGIRRTGPLARANNVLDA